MNAPLSRKSNAYGFYIVGILMIAYTLSFMDRVVLSLLVAPIRAEFGLGDTGIALLMGFGFALLYTAFGLPFGALADRTNRRNLIVAGIIGWSLATGLCGIATSFTGLLLARAAVGVGEATLTPAAHSTIGDRFARERLGLAIAIYTAGPSIGGGLAIAFGGMLVQWAEHSVLHIPLLGVVGGWRLALVSVGLLGLPLALLVLATLREAPRRVGQQDMPGWTELFAYIAGRPTAYAALIGAFACAVIASYIPVLWAPALFTRSHGMSTREIGTILGAIVGIAGLAGVIGGGMLSDRLARRGVLDAPVRVIAWAAALQLPILAIAYVVADRTVALALLTVGVALTGTASSLQGAALQLLTPPRMRGRVIAIYLLCITVIGLGLGPLLIGVLSDDVFTGPRGLGPALATVSSLALVICVITLWQARATIRRAVAEEAVRAQTAS